MRGTGEQTQSHFFICPGGNDCGKGQIKINKVSLINKLKAIQLDGWIDFGLGSNLSTSMVANIIPCITTLCLSSKPRVVDKKQSIFVIFEAGVTPNHQH